MNICVPRTSSQSRQEIACKLGSRGSHVRTFPYFSNDSLGALVAVLSQAVLYKPRSLTWGPLCMSMCVLYVRTRTAREPKTGGKIHDQQDVGSRRPTSSTIPPNGYRKEVLVYFYNQPQLHRIPLQYGHHPRDANY